MSMIPKSRQDLVQLIDEHFGKLVAELEGLDSQTSQLVCEDNLSIKDILAIRLWWTKAVMRWVNEGRKGKTPEIPAPGYHWQDTPALNQQTVMHSQSMSYSEIKQKLIAEQKKIMKLIAGLSDQELSQPGFYAWAGKWPLMRWLSMNTSSQYAGARKLIRKALKQPQ